MDELVPTPPPTPGRESNGRFAAGNPGGPGGARRRTSELRRAAEEAVTPEMVQAAMRKCAMLALQGNLQALRILLDRACGKPGEAPLDEPLGITLPNLRTAASCAAAIDRIAAAIQAGTVDPASAKVLLDVVQCRMKAIELTDLETRLAELEKQAATVDFGRRT